MARQTNLKILLLQIFFKDKISLLKTVQVKTSQQPIYFLCLPILQIQIICSEQQQAITYFQIIANLQGNLYFRRNSQMQRMKNKMKMEKKMIMSHWLPKTMPTLINLKGLMNIICKIRSSSNKMQSSSSMEPKILSKMWPLAL